MSNIGEKEKLKLIKECLRKLSVLLKFVLVYYIQARNSPSFSYNLQRTVDCGRLFSSIILMKNGIIVVIV